MQLESLITVLLYYRSPNMNHKDVALEVLTDQHNFLTHAINSDLMGIASFLYSRHVITKQLIGELLSTTSSTRAAKLLLAVAEKIQSDENESSFFVLVEALEGELVSHQFAKKLVQCYGKLNSTVIHNLCVLTQQFEF